MCSSDLAGPTTEVEPNGDRSSASELPINGAIRGALSPMGEGAAPDEDWFVLSLDGPSSQQVRIQLSAEDDTDFVLHWMPPTDQPPPAPKRKRRQKKRKQRGPMTLATVDNAGDGGVEVLAPTVLPPGRHYLRVTQAKKRRKKRRKKRTVERPATAFERPYRLTSTVVDPDGRLEQEPNNTRESAGVLRPGEPREGYLGWHKDSDWYKLELDSIEPGSSIRVDVSGVPEVKTRLWMVTRRGKGLVKVPEGSVPWDSGRPVTIRDVAVHEKKGPYFVEVRTMRSANPHERYTLTAVVEPPQEGRELEPNWRPANATPIGDAASVEGVIGHPTDWDTYRIDALDPMVATVTVSGLEGVDLRLELIDSNHKVVSEINEGGLGATETIPLIPVGPQPTYVRVSSRDYTFDVDKAYRVEVTMTEAGDRELEPNDSFKEASRVTLEKDRPYSGLIHPRGDLDYFVIQVRPPDDEEQETRTLSVRLKAPEDVSMTVLLYDGDRALITRKAGISGGETRSITHAFSPGRYYVAVRADTPHAANSESGYQITLIEQ